jgi:hypothetical protein
VVLSLSAWRGCGPLVGRGPIVVGRELSSRLHPTTSAMNKTVHLKWFFIVIPIRISKKSFPVGVREGQRKYIGERGCVSAPSARRSTDSGLLRNPARLERNAARRLGSVAD